MRSATDAPSLPTRLTTERFNSIVRALATAIDKNGKPLALDSLIASQGDQTFHHPFTDPNVRHDIRSLSKPVLSLVLGIAMDRGLQLRGQPLELNTRIWPFFQDKVHLRNPSNSPLLERITIRHLLTHTIGHEIGLMFRKDVAEREPDSLLDYVFNSPLAHEPGRHFVYSNAGAFLLSALIQEELGIHLATWAGELLFAPLGIGEYEWINYGPYCAAASGLRLTNTDLHKIGRLLIEDGRCGGRQIVPEPWIRAMRSPQVETPRLCDPKRPFPKRAYGYGLWISDNDRYYCDGTDGQYLIVLPESGIVVTVLSHQPDLRPILPCLTALL